MRTDKQVLTRCVINCKALNGYDSDGKHALIDHIGFNYAIKDRIDD